MGHCLGNKVWPDQQSLQTLESKANPMPVRIVSALWVLRARVGCESLCGLRVPVQVVSARAGCEFLRGL
eukprot:1158406-Pelagomonas_calceolata.AAC.6